MSSDVYHHGEVLRLLIHAGKMYLWGGSRTFRVVVTGRVEVFGSNEQYSVDSLSLVMLRPTGSRPRVLPLSCLGIEAGVESEDSRDELLCLTGVVLSNVEYAEEEKVGCV